MANATHKVIFGQYTFDNNSIFSGSYKLVQNPVGTEIQINTFSVEVLCYDEGILDFKLNTPIYLLVNDKQVGVFYAKSVERLNPFAYQISGESAIGLLENQNHYGGIYTGQTVGEVVKSICSGVQYSLKGHLSEIKLYGYLPIASARENLSQVLIATGAAIRTDLDGVLHIEYLYGEPTSLISSDEVFTSSKVNYDKEVTSVLVTEHQYIKSEEEMELFSGLASDGDRIIFRDPMHSLEATGFTIKEEATNYAVLSAGTGTLKGKKYIHNTREVVRSVKQGATENVKRLKDCTLISIVNSSAVADRIADFYRFYDEAYELEFIRTNQEVGEIAKVVNPYNRKVTEAYAKTMVVELGAFSQATAEYVPNFVPTIGGDTTIEDRSEILTGSGSWQVPEGVTEVTAVLIDGGEAGQTGEDGELGAQYKSSTKTATQSSYVAEPTEENQDTFGNASATSSASSSSSASKGAGGQGGAGGRPGRVFRVEIDVSGQSSIAYSCGDARANGAAFTETTFGSFSSSSGSESDAGYTDPVTGDRFAAAGLNGSSGGSGGEEGESGEPVDGVPGGNPGYGGSSTKTSKDSYGNLGVGTNCEVSATFQRRSAGGGGAGGNSGAVKGSPGLDANVISSVSISASASSGSAAGTAYSPAINGGNGGNGANGGDAVKYGCGGDGGGGGGGTGKPGQATANCTVDGECHLWYQSHVAVPGRDYTARATSNAGGTTATPGIGGEGGKGKPGCIILYYSMAVKNRSGQAKDKNGFKLLDKLKRRLIT